MMKTVLSAMVAAAAVTQVAAECNNGCSGHGQCGADDICTCYPMWGGGDCSERKCPSRPAWSDVADTSVYATREPHYYAECSGRGTCDPELGECTCDPGFEGEGCQRMSCPDDCSGHGTCELMSSANPSYTGWDKDMIQVCVCDPGYEGHNCMNRKCKLGDDPISRYLSSGTAESPHEQTVLLQVGAGTFDAGSEFLIEYTDWRGASWLTRPIGLDTLSVVSITEALTSLPQRAIDSVTVTLTTNSGTDKLFTITFDSPETPGTQPTLVLHTDGCALDGCQPVYTGVTENTGADLTTATVTPDATTGTGERAVCSNRGRCDSETGNCVCYRGFYGHACEMQTLVL